MFWIYYLLLTIIFSYLISSLARDKSLVLFTFFLVIFLTPAQIDFQTGYYAPSVFSFFFNLLFEQEYSLRVLRPLLLSVFVYFSILFTLLTIRRKFF